MEPPRRNSFRLSGARDTLYFGDDPVTYVNEGINQYGSTFEALMLTLPTTFVTTYGGVSEVLDNIDTFNHAEGYTDLLAGVMGPDNIVVKDGDEWKRQRDAFEPLFESSESGVGFSVMKEIIAPHMKQWRDTEAHVEFYEAAKILTSEVIGALFMQVHSGSATGKAQHLLRGREKDTDEAPGVVFKQLMALQTLLWRGVTSIPLPGSFSIAGFSLKTAFTKGVEAREQICDIVANRMDQVSSDGGASKCPFASLVASPTLTNQDTVSNSVLFTSSLTVKTFASLLASITFVLSTPGNGHILARLREELRVTLDLGGGVPPEPGLATLTYAQLTNEMPYLDAILKEVERMYPPVFGMARGASHATTVSGIKVAEGNKVWCSIYHANRDPEVFQDPEQFNPDRWAIPGVKPHMTFSAGSRSCIGQAVTRTLVKLVTVHLVSMEFTQLGGQDLSYRWLPVARPVGGLRMAFRPATKSD